MDGDAPASSLQAIYARGFYPSSMDFDSITHIHYAFFDVTSSCEVVSTDPCVGRRFPLHVAVGYPMLPE
jgi:GH18 family chitinase